MEQFKKELLGIKGQDIIPDGVMNGTTLLPNMLTMIGYRRLTNIETLIHDIVSSKIEGDVIETGVWRGGACIFMRKILNELSSEKTVYVADSFEGLPAPNEKYIHDKGDTHHKVPMLSVSLEDVTNNFQQFDLLDNVIFVKGWFKNTLPLLDNQFSLIRLDGDMYESTIDALNNLYPKLSNGGYCIIDDYNAVNGCKIAVEDYRAEHNITSKIIEIDGTAIYWKK